MDIYTWIIENKELAKVLYGLIISLICVIIVLKVDKLYRLSLHQGIRYFRNAFFFFGIAFVIRFLFSAFAQYAKIEIEYYFLTGLFEFFLIMGGFFLLYSLLWKKIEVIHEEYTSSLFNAKIAVFYFMALILIALDYVWKAYYFLFFSQIIVFIFASIISFVNYKRNGSKHKFLKYYFMAMLLVLIAWVLNALIAIYFNWSQEILTNIYFLNMLFFLLFLFGVIKLTKPKM